MNEAFFIASKIGGPLIRAETWLVIFLVLGFVAMLRGRKRAAAAWTGLTLALLVGLSAFPLGNLLLGPLESIYPENPPVTGKLDGIIVLGGAEDLGPYFRWHGFQVNAAAERITAGVELARRFPDAKLIYTGGTAGLGANPRHAAPSRMVTAFWRQMGVPAAQIEVEDRSRTTSENAQDTYAMLKPQKGQHWLLVTSAWHMPRAMETFDSAGWTGVTAWPVDYRSRARTFHFEWHLDRHLTDLNIALKEEIGALAYRIMGK